jgi:transposase-like protein
MLVLVNGKLKNDKYLHSKKWTLIMKKYLSNRYPDTLINQVVNQVTDHNRLLSEVAKEYGVSSRVVYQWVKSTTEPVEVKKDLITEQIASLQRQIQSLNKQLQMIA